MEDQNLAEALSRSVDNTSQPASEQIPPDSALSTTVDTFTEEKIQSIVKMGFTREDAIQELRMCNGDANLAAASLLAKSIQMPSN
jgi:Holliday junction resolvasome RuvABC DNA-binding subunit